MTDFPDLSLESPPRFLIDIGGMCAGATVIISPNCDARPDEARISLLVIHNISLPPGEFGGDAVVDFFTNHLDHRTHLFYESIKDLHVSAHFFVRRNGELIQFVSCEMRAWHAGVSRWNGHERCNDFSIGIEVEGTDDLAYADVQYATLIELAQALFHRYGILDVTGHSNIAPGRKTDPGSAFDWKRFLAGIA